MAAISANAWHYLSDEGEQQGPIEAEHLAELCADGVVSLDTPVFNKMLGEWQQLEKVSALVRMAQHATPSSESAVWFAIDKQGAQIGPLTSVQLGEMVESGVVTTESAVWSKVLGEWARMRDTPTLVSVWDCLGGV